MTDDRKKTPRFSQFAMASARDTAAFEPQPREEPTTVSPPARPLDPAPQTSQQSEPGESAPATSSKGASRTDPDEMISFTVRLPAALYMRLRRSLALREKLGEFCVVAITRELDARK